MLTRRSLVAGALAAPVAFAASRGMAAVTAPSLYELLREPAILDAAISPSGKKIAVLGQSPAGDGFVTAIALVDGDNPSAPGKRLDLGDMDIEMVEWANDQRLLVWLKKEIKITASGPTGGMIKSDLTVRRILAIGADGSKPVLLFENKNRSLKGNMNLGMVADYMPDDPDHIIMQAGDYVRYVWALYKVNVNTGAAELVERGDDSTRGWISQRGLPIARLDYNNRGTVQTLSLRAPGESAWTPYRQMRENEEGRVDFQIVAATNDAQVVLALTATENDPVVALRPFNLKTRQLGTEVVRRGSHDAESVITDSAGRLIGTAFVEDRLAYEFTDPAMKSHYRAIDAYFGKACNLAITSLDAAHNRMLFWASGPREPGAYYFYDRTTRALEPMGAARDWLTPERLASMEVLSVTARDGQALTAYLSVPIVGAGPRPLVVLPHGGPEAHDSFAWDDWAQVLAARGWFVLQPNFRGSDGYGQAFTRAGWRRWGDLMQDDVEDCVAKVVASGRVDPDRIAIMGASYGGYAALMGPLRRPELYKAAVSIAGVSDLPDFLNWVRTQDGSTSPVYDYWKRNIGDPDTERARLEASSPRRQAARLIPPVLLIHGKEDGIVPVEQSKTMRDALKKAGKPVEYLEIEDMGHGGWTPQQSMAVLKRAVEFLEPRLRA